MMRFFKLPPETSRYVAEKVVMGINIVGQVAVMIALNNLFNTSSQEAQRNTINLPNSVPNVGIGMNRNI